MKVLLFLLVMVAAWRVAATGCGGDNCANHVTGTFGGIGVPIKTRVSMCNSYLRTTIKPAPTTITKTITKYTNKVPSATGYGGKATRTTKGRATTITPKSVPTFATGQCPGKTDFSSACSCWGSVTATKTTLKRSTVTATTTTYLNIGCSPAATSISRSSRFECSKQKNKGTCSCLRDYDGDDVCVKIGGLEYGSGKGPCDKYPECDAKGQCKEKGAVCVYDGSCECGKRRCYKAAVKGCEYQGRDRAYGIA